MKTPSGPTDSDGPMTHPFSGVIPMEIEIRMLGVVAKRRLRAIYDYTPPWPFFDPKTRTEQTASPSLAIALEVWTLPGVLVAIEDREPNWVPVNQLLRWGVLTSRAHDRLGKLIDLDARVQDHRRRRSQRKAR
jgi:hypothetical protein